MDLTKSSFQYNAVVRVNSAPIADLAEIFPNAKEISLSSRSFTNYAECVSSAKVLLDEYVTAVNSLGAVQVKIGTEVNPKYSGHQTISKDWVDAEVARLWVYDRTMEGSGNRIDAIARTSIFAVERAPQSLN